MSPEPLGFRTKSDRDKALVELVGRPVTSSKFDPQGHRPSYCVPMKKSKKIAFVASLVLALGLPTTLFAGTAHAADTAKPTPKLDGQRFVLMDGFNGETPSTVLYHLTILKNNGNTFVGTQRFRDCTNNIEKCKSEGAAGAGWTKPEAVFLVRTSSNTYVLRSGGSQGQITLGTKGVTKAYIIGSGQAKVSGSRDGRTLQSQVYSCQPPPTSPSRGGDEYIC